MPELPEVETVRRSLEKMVIGRSIRDFIVCREDYIHEGSTLVSSLIGKRIGSIDRKGKILAIHLSDGWILLHHLGMTGRLLLVPVKTELATHTHVRILLSDDESELRQWDPRRFGYIAILREENLDHFAPWTNLGIDPFNLNLPIVRQLLHQRKQPIKSFLLDQRHIAGMGNIYADESLFRAKIHPLQSAGDLTEEQTKDLLCQMKKVLLESIAAGGSTTNDYQKLDGTLGEFQHKHRVYRRTDQPCKTCGDKIAKQVIGGRSTHFCPSCQILRIKKT